MDQQIGEIVFWVVLLGIALIGLAVSERRVSVLDKQITSSTSGSGRAGDDRSFREPQRSDSFGRAVTG